MQSPFDFLGAASHGIQPQMQAQPVHHEKKDATLQQAEAKLQQLLEDPSLTPQERQEIENELMKGDEARKKWGGEHDSLGRRKRINEGKNAVKRAIQGTTETSVNTTPSNVRQ